MKKTLIALALLLVLGLFIACDEEAAVVEDIPTDVIPKAGSVPAAIIGQWVEYDIEDVGIVKLALVGKEEYEGTPCYWLEVVVGDEEETMIVRVLIDVEAYEEGISAIQDWLEDPMIPDEGMFADMMDQQMTGAMPTEDELDEIYSSMDDILDVVKRLVIQIDSETAFELDLPDLVDMMIEQMETGMEMMAELDDMYDDYEEEEYEIEMPELAVVGEEDVKIGEETVRAIHLTIEVEGETANFWVTPAIPFLGLVKVEVPDGTPVVVKDFGQSGAESSMTVENIEKMGAEELMMMLMMGGMGGDMPDYGGMGEMPDFGDMPDMSGMEGMSEYMSPEEMAELEEMMEMLEGMQ
ncbi:hypothetical protein K8R78_04450 [bacterium]|nr:hypothetical protein [bacterium]